MYLLVQILAGSGQPVATNGYLYFHEAPIQQLPHIGPNLPLISAPQNRGRLVAREEVRPPAAGDRVQDYLDLAADENLPTAYARQALTTFLSRAELIYARMGPILVTFGGSTIRYGNLPPFALTKTSHLRAMIDVADHLLAMGATTPPPTGESLVIDHTRDSLGHRYELSRASRTLLQSRGATTLPRSFTLSDDVRQSFVFSQGEDTLHRQIIQSLTGLTVEQLSYFGFPEVIFRTPSGQIVVRLLPLQAQPL